MDDEIFDDNLENELLEGSDGETGETREENANDNQDNDGNEAEGENEGDKSKKEVKKIKKIRPHVKLDPDRLCGPRGIPILPKLFENVKFKGKKHEKEDLDLLMYKLEHWAHRLYPSQPFDQVIEKIEKLGSKKPVKVCIAKMRLDLPILNEDFVSREESGDEREENNIAVDPFEELLRQERTRDDSSSQAVISDNNPANTSTTNVLSEEVRQRIERNKKLAAERRRKTQERNSLLQNQSLDSLNNSEMENTNAKNDQENPEINSPSPRTTIHETNTSGTTEVEPPNHETNTSGTIEVEPPTHEATTFETIEVEPPTHEANTSETIEVEPPPTHETNTPETIEPEPPTKNAKNNDDNEEELMEINSDDEAMLSQFDL